MANLADLLVVRSLSVCFCLSQAGAADYALYYGITTLPDSCLAFGITKLIAIVVIVLGCVYSLFVTVMRFRISPSTVETDTVVAAPVTTPPVTTPPATPGPAVVQPALDDPTNPKDASSRNWIQLQVLSSRSNNTTGFDPPVTR